MAETDIKYGSMRIYAPMQAIDKLRSKQCDYEFWMAVANLVDKI